MKGRPVSGGDDLRLDSRVRWRDASMKGRPVSGGDTIGHLLHNLFGEPR